VLDFENGELRPEEIPNLFPAVQMIVTNTFDHTPEKPRFRVIMPATQVMTPEVYKHIVQTCIIGKLNEAGYWVDRGRSRDRKPSNMQLSGLDWSTTFPHSLFYLPGQARNPADSFFHVYFDGRRQPISPSLWIENTTIPLRPELEVLPVEWDGSAINERLVEQAKVIWRGSSAYPHRGNEMFFNLGLSLRRAGMNPQQLEATLRNEAQYGRTPSERLDQIPSIMASLRKSLARAS
jgi:hypothetical protein